MLFRKLRTFLPSWPGASRLLKRRGGLITVVLFGVLFVSLKFVSDNNNTISNDIPRLAACPLKPPGIVGRRTIPEDSPPLSVQAHRHTELHPGGHWWPLHCTPRFKVAILVPYRDRAEHLRRFVAYMHEFLQRQLIEYAIYVVEQSMSARFNRARLLNIGFTEAKKDNDWDCYVMHDVDMLPEDDRCLYYCPEAKKPRHMSSARSNRGYALGYSYYVGGVTAFRSEDFEAINGFSNLFFSWGGEDDDMYYRIKHRNMSMTRYNEDIGRYYNLKHGQEPRSSARGSLLKTRKHRFVTDGLNNLNYTLQTMAYRPLFTYISADFEDIKTRKMIKEIKKEGHERQKLAEEDAERAAEEEYKEGDEEGDQEKNYGAPDVKGEDIPMHKTKIFWEDPIEKVNAFYDYDELNAKDYYEHQYDRHTFDNIVKKNKADDYSVDDRPKKDENTEKHKPNPDNFPKTIKKDNGKRKSDPVPKKKEESETKKKMDDKYKKILIEHKMHKYTSTVNITKMVILNGYFRGGSSLGASFLSKHPDSFYTFEPLDAIYQAIYGTDKYWQATNIAFNEQGDFRTKASAEVKTVNAAMLDLLQCHIAYLPIEFFTHPFRFDRSNVYRNTDSCLSHSNLSSGECKSHLRGVCPKYFTMGGSTDKCRDMITMIGRLLTAGKRYTSKYKKCLSKVDADVDNCADIFEGMCHGFFPKTGDVLQSQCIRASKFIASDDIENSDENTKMFVPFIKHKNCLLEQTSKASIPCIRELTDKCKKSQVRIAKIIRGSIGDLEPILQSKTNPSDSIKIIHLVRDPRAIASSRASLLRGNKRKHIAAASSDVTDETKLTCTQILADVKAINAMSTDTRQSVLLVKYEDLVTYTSEVVKRMYNFIQLPISNSVLDWIHESMSSEGGKQRSKYTLHRSNSTHATVKWQEKFTQSQLDAINSHGDCKELFDILDY